MCPHCGEINGIVKKSGLLKISHEKYRNKKADAEIEIKLGMLCFTNAIEKMIYLTILITLSYSYRSRFKRSG